MYLTQQSEYALRVLLYTAHHRPNLVNIADIADFFQISKSHLMKVVTALVKEGYLEGLRGKGGGIRLARTPESIVLGEVVRRLEPMVIVTCLNSTDNCVIGTACGLQPILRGVPEAVLRYLDGFTLVDAMRGTDFSVRHEHPLVFVPQTA